MNAKVKKTILFVYISIVAHLYILLIASVSIDKEMLSRLFNPVLEAKETVIENIIVETRTQSETPDEGKISDKPNTGSGNLSEKNIYNYFNPSLSDPSSTGSADTGSEEERKLFDAEGNPIKLTPRQALSRGNIAGDYRASYYDPDIPIEVSMDSAGDISLDTIPADFAEYFFEMSDKIGENWYDFFPVFQYYMGIIENGDVVVTFELDMDGNVINPRITSSFGYGVIDQSTLNAVAYSKNFGPLPPSLQDEAAKEGQEYITINFRFIYMSREYTD